MFKATVPVTVFINRESNYFLSGHKNRVGKILDLSHKWGKGFGKWAAHPHPIFMEVPLQVFTTVAVINYFITVTVSAPPPPPPPTPSLSIFLSGQVIHTTLIQDTFWLIVVSFAFTSLIFSLLEEIES